MAAVPSSSGKSIAPARRCAYEVLRRVFERGAYADRALHAQARSLSPRDRALAMRLSYGAVQRKGTLDHLIAGLSERPVTRLQPPLLAALRLGLYELLYLTGSPDYAVVADAVELAKTNSRAGHGLVNAVLRRAVREGPDALLAPLSDATPEQAAVMHSHPQWLARMWWQQLGAEQARALMAVDNDPSELALRANALVTDAATLREGLAASGVQGHLDDEIPEALVLDGPLAVRDCSLWQQGAFQAQSRAAMLVARVLQPRPGERVLDLCAAPGGKATHLAALMEDRGEVLAVEHDRRRAGELVRTAARLHATSVHVELADARLSRAQGAGFDRVLVDPPCSGLGTLQARADLRWRVTADSIAAVARTQAEILAAGAAAVRPGGVLVYSTCTISPTENEHVIADFLDSHADFSLDDLAAELPAYALDRASDASSVGVQSAPGRSSGLVLTLPHRDHTAGFFIARLRRG